MESWQFIQSPAGDWYWLCSNVINRQTRTSTATFATRMECVANAMTSGYQKIAPAFSSSPSPRMHARVVSADGEVNGNIMSYGGGSRGGGGGGARSHGRGGGSRGEGVNGNIGGNSGGNSGGSAGTGAQKASGRGGGGAQAPAKRAGRRNRNRPGKRSGSSKAG